MSRDGESNIENLCEKPHIRETIVVEGRDDTLAINRAVDAVTIETHGYGISKNTWKKISDASKLTGIIVFTDPDHAGNEIRKKVITKFPEAKQAFLSLEKAERKGDIGVENAKPEDIVDALNKARCTTSEQRGGYTMNDLALCRLCASDDSRIRREIVGDLLGVGYSNAKGLLKRLNTMSIDREEFDKAINDMKKILSEKS